MYAAGQSYCDFDFFTASQSNTAFPALAICLEGQNDFWDSISGTLRSQVSATGQTCSLPLPPFAKSATCNFALFDEEGSINFESVSQFGGATKHVTVIIPRQNIHGVWQAITQT